MTLKQNNCNNIYIYCIFRSLSVRQNLLRRITVEELRAMPNIVSLDLSYNPLDCDVEFKDAVQWLTDHGVTPLELSGYLFIL